VKRIINPISNLLEREQDGRPVTVAFLGGSITWGGNCSDIETKSYRALVGNWFREEFKTDVTPINGGFGGTGSGEGAYRFEEQVLSHNPDLVFTEFSINDAQTVQSKCMASHEAIFTKAWKQDPKTGFIMLISGSRYDGQGELVTKKIGADFGLHCIDVGSWKRDLVLGGKITDNQLWLDDVHPTDEGHAIYADYVIKYLKNLKRGAKAQGETYCVGEELTYWLSAQRVNARLVPAVDCETSGDGWRLTENHYAEFDGVYPDTSTWPDRTTWPFPYRKGLMCTETPGDSIAYTGNMIKAGIALDFVKGKCVLDVFIDGELVDTIDHSQPEGRFPRVPEFPVTLDGGKHKVKIVLKDGKLQIGYFQIS